VLIYVFDVFLVKNIWTKKITKINNISEKEIGQKFWGIIIKQDLT
jgi:hypothetical protein